MLGGFFSGGLMRVREVGRVAAMCLAAGVIGAVPGAVAAGKAKDWSLDLSAGVKFDDRVAVDENDASAASDTAVVLELDAAYKLVKEYIDCQLVLAGGGATDDPEGLKDFDYEGYKYNPSLSTAKDWVFTRRQ